MPVTPEGAPAWTRTAKIEIYGGHTEKRNVLDRGPIDQLTDVGASQFARMTADAVAITRTAPFAILQLWLMPAGYGAPAIEYAHMATGVRLTTYYGDAAPTGYPTATNNGNGDITVTFADSYVDPYGVAGAFAIRHVTADAIYKAVARAVPERVSDTAVRIRVFDEADAAIIPKVRSEAHPEDKADELRVTLQVW